jgi:hypothetical protein
MNLGTTLPATDEVICQMPADALPIIFLTHHGLHLAEEVMWYTCRSFFRITSKRGISHFLEPLAIRSSALLDRASHEDFLGGVLGGVLGGGGGGIVGGPDGGLGITASLRISWGRG